HGGLLGRRHTDETVMREHDIAPIDLLVVNLYPFARTVARPEVSMEDAIENIDIGGPAMLRAAAQNHDRVLVVSDPSEYAGLVDTLREQGGTTPAMRRRLAARAYARTAHYDGMSADWLGAHIGEPEPTPFAPTLHLSLNRSATLRYGENPHQGGALYVEADAPAEGIVATARVLAGKPLSYNNLADADAA